MSGSRATLWLIVAALVLPFALGAGLYLSGWRPAGMPKGQMLQPQPLPADLLRATADQRGKWLLLLDEPDRCGAACAQRIDEIRRIHVALYKDMGRVHRAVLLAQPQELRTAIEAQPDLQVLPAPAEWRVDAATLYIVDPQGQLLLRYGAPIAAKDVKRDLERLLRFSWTG